MVEALRCPGYLWVARVDTWQIAAQRVAFKEEPPLSPKRASRPVFQALLIAALGRA